MSIMHNPSIHRKVTDASDPYIRWTGEDKQMIGSMSGVRKFAISFDENYAMLSSALFLSPAEAYIELTGEEVVVRMSWAFRCRFPRKAVVATSHLQKRPLSRGVHGWRGRWLVNGSGDAVLSITLKPSQRAWVIGFPVSLSELLVSVKDPAELARALTGR